MMIQSLANMIGVTDITSELPDGRWVRAVPLPWRTGVLDRIKDAWAVVTERAYAIRWPGAGELEAVIDPFEVFDRERQQRRAGRAALAEDKKEGGE